MGHGTSGQANTAYPALASLLRQQDNRAYLGTVEGSPDLAAVKADLLAAGVKKEGLAHPP